MPDHGTVGRKHAEYIETGQRVNETTADSDVGGAGTDDELDDAHLRDFLRLRVRDGVLPWRSEPVIRGAGCGNSTSPDLWEPRAGNGPGRPDPGAGGWPPGHCARAGVFLRGTLIGEQPFFYPLLRRTAAASNRQVPVIHSGVPRFGGAGGPKSR